MSKIFALNCVSCGAPLTSQKYPLACDFCGVENWAKDTFSFSEQRAVANLRLIHSAQATYQAVFGDGNYAAAVELFMSSLIPKELAEALNARKVINDQGIQCEGTSKPLSGYRFYLRTTLPATSRPATFSTSAIVAVETHKQAMRNFYINESGVVRFSEKIVPDENSEIFDVEFEQRVWS